MLLFQIKIETVLEEQGQIVISMPHLTAPLSPKGIIQTVPAVLRLEIEILNKVEKYTDMKHINH